MSSRTTKPQIKLAMVVALTALIAGALLATGADEPESTAGHQTTGASDDRR
ncbi:hypothetical protein [Actinomadura alba]|uniref:Uncharacterized protein n=1 Tax=Actinomadura alba TaxID=406431 RepID=A0ABR7M023_9ACTN|nr:hypothetical protein [Actinomadura alba]MBC6470461.1 hypothetical protein [Actinomadura alba]